ncbi:MAG: hypothetical protein R6X15_11640 [Pseudomonadota bacterium]
MPHLLVAISAHGFGHLAQVAPVVNRLRERLPDLVLTLRTTLPRAKLEERIDGGFALQSAADDFGMLQHSALELDLPASLQRYKQLHGNWQQNVDRVVAELSAASPDLLLADVPYLTLAAAHRAGIPSVALCSLNWASIVEGCLAAEPGVTAMVGRMREAYNRAEVFFCPAPSMPMPGLTNIRPVGTIATQAKKRRDELVKQGMVNPAERLVLVAMGGMDHRLPVERWPQNPTIRYLVPEAWGVQREDVTAIEASAMHFSDLLASSDAMITKPGYGIFSEAAVNAVPLLYVRRGNWPEEPYLIEWLKENARGQELELGALERGEHLPLLESLFEQPAAPPVDNDGAEEIAAYLFDRLRSGC